MTSISDLRDQAAERARDLKDQKLADWHHDDRPELHPTVIGWRGDQEVVVMIPMDVDRDDALHAARLAAVGFGCDTLALSVDTWGTSRRTNPVTGKAWGEREMQQVVEQHQGIERGWITEALSTFVVNRAGDVASAWQPYTATRRTNVLGIVSWSIEWGEGRTADPGDTTVHQEGRVIDSLVASMNRPTVQHYMGRAGITGEEYGLPPVEAQAHADCGVVKSLVRAGFQGGVMLSSDDPRRSAIIEKSLGHLLRWGDPS